MKVYVEGTDDQVEEKDKFLPDLKEGDEVVKERHRTEAALYSATAKVYGSTTRQDA